MSDPQPQPFRLSVESPDPCRRVIKVEVPRAEYDRQYQQRLTAAVRGHQRPGFRKGKTPRAIVEKELGGRLRAETFEGLVPRAYRAAVIEHGLHPITEPVLENLVFEEDRDLAFDLAVEVRPEITAEGYDGLRVEKRAVAVADEEVDEVVARLRESRALWETAARPAQAGDQVVLDLVPRLDDGSLDEPRRAAGQRVLVGDEQNLPAFNEVLPGVEAGLERDVTIDYPEDYPNPALRSRTVTFLLQVAEVQHKVLPEVDDAFAARLQEGQTLLELRGRIREGLAAEAERRVAEDLDAQVLEQLLARNEVPVPPSLVETWLRSALEDLRRRQQQQGGPMNEEQEKQVREAYRPLAERQIRGMFLLEAVRRQESITVGDEEVEDRIAAIAAEHGFDLEKYRAFLEQGEERQRIRQDLLERKTYDFLLSRAEIVAAPAADGAGVPAAERG
jgi:trigger factor